MKTAETLFKVADYMATHGATIGPGGWVWEAEGRVCVEGAFLAVLGISSDTVRAAGVLTRKHSVIRAHPAYRALSEHVGLSGSKYLCSWNDRVADPDHVLATIRECAEKELIKEEELVDEEL